MKTDEISILQIVSAREIVVIAVLSAVVFLLCFASIAL
jgi:hypothetical protein